MTTGELVGRDDDLRAVAAALGVEHGPAAVLIEGEMGIGKTAFWRRALAACPQRRTLSCRPGGADVRLSFAGLADLLEPAVDEVAGELHAPQRRALEAALLRREPGPMPPDGRAIGTAVLAVLRRLAAERPLLVAVDDIQWLDEPSAAALRFALRRLGDAPIAVLAAHRLEAGAGHPLDLAGALPPERLLRLRLGPLTAAELGALLRARLNLELSRATLARLQVATGGNAFFALEIGRELRGREPAPDEPLPIPDDVRQLVGGRLARLSATAREALLTAAALTRPTLTVLHRTRPDAEEALGEAMRAGVIAASGDRLAFAHPLLASVAHDDASPAERRRVHAALAEAVEDGEERARHLALAATGPDAGVAAALDAAAATARGRGAPEAAAEMYGRAAALTPLEDAGGRHGRVLAAAECLFQAGEFERADALLEPAVEAAPDAAARADALLLQGTVRGESRGLDAALAVYERALEEAPASTAATVHQRLAWNRLLFDNAATAERHAEAALALAGQLEDPVPQATSIATAALVRFIRGRGIDRALLERGMRLEHRAREAGAWMWLDECPSLTIAVLLLWAGELDAARPRLEELHRLTAAAGDDLSRVLVLCYLGPLESRAGNLRLAAELGREQLRIARETGHEPLLASALFASALASAGLGDVEGTRAATTEGLRLAERTGHGYYALGNLSVLGVLELSLGEAPAAAERLSRALERLHALGIEPPGVFPIRADLVEALVAVGEVERAGAVAAELEEKADAPWALALAGRARGLAAEARGDREAAFASFDEALAQHEHDGHPLERARTLLVLGAARRRARAKRAARETLTEALAVFEERGADAWARRARAEIARIGGRAATPPGRLTPAEAAIAELVREGRTNREVAAALHLSERTVEWNLSRVYAKLGVRSRTQLAALAPPKSGDLHG